MKCLAREEKGQDRDQCQQRARDDQFGRRDEREFTAQRDEKPSVFSAAAFSTMACPQPERGRTGREEKRCRSGKAKDRSEHRGNWAVGLLSSVIH